MRRAYRNNLLIVGSKLTAFVLVVFVHFATAQSPSSYSALKKGFSNPPQAARLRCYWWWLNGHTDEATITRDLEEMARMGYGGALLIDANGANQNGNDNVPAGPLYGSPDWIKLYLHALKTANRLGLEISLNATSGWNLGGPLVKPEEASKVLTWSRIQVAGGQHVRVNIAQPQSKNGFYRDIALLAYPLHHGADLQPQPDDKQGDNFTGGPGSGTKTLAFRSAALETGFSMPDSSAMLYPGSNPDDKSQADAALSEVKDISAKLQGDLLEWDPPKGEWELLRIGYTDSGAKVSTSSGAWQGLAIDYLDHRALDIYWDTTLKPLLTAAKPYLGKSLKYLTSDSWELGGTNWTGNFREQFIKLRGYDPLLYLPVASGRILEDRNTSTRFLTDLRRTVADLVVTEHYDAFARHAKEYGIGIQVESGGPHGAPIDALETFRSASMAQTEYWAPNSHRKTPTERFFTKEGASAANIYGLAYNAQEGMTTIGTQWNEDLAHDLKPAFDQAMTEGMNRLIWHEFTSSPDSTGFPGQEYFAGTHLNPKVPWWSAAHDFFLYLNRAQYLMQQGVPVVDVLYYYGDHVPNFVRLKSDDPAGVLPGYDYDVTNEDALLRLIKIEGGKLEGPKGIRWRLLTLPKTRRLSLQTLKKVRSYVHQGGSIVGLPPLSTTGEIAAADQKEFDSIVETVWQRCASGETKHYGKGSVFCTTTAREALASLHVGRDFDPHEAPLDYIHRRADDTDIYFVRNTTSSAVQTDASFGVTGKSPELWNAVSGTVRAPAAYKNDANATSVSLHLPPYGSIFVVFRSGAPLPPSKEPVESGNLSLAEPWELGFQHLRGAPEGPQQANELESWTDSQIPGIRYFSGTAIYKTHFEFPQSVKNTRLLLKLSSMHDIARVRLNGRYVGTIWCDPLELEIDSGLQQGRNELEIEVTNNWANRIIGDLQPGVTYPVTQTNIKFYKPDSPLSPSGLIGPVTLTYLKEPGTVTSRQKPKS